MNQNKMCNLRCYTSGNSYLVLALLFALLNMGAIFGFFGFQEYDDTPSYIEHIRLFQGREVNIHPWRMLTPLGPILALPFEFLGEGAGLIIQNIIFYFLGTYLIFRIIELITGDKKQALWGAILFVAALPIILFGLSYLTDMGAWFFYLFSLYLTLLYLRNKDEKLVVINGLFSGAGVLMKANAGLGILFFPIMIFLFSQFNFKKKIMKILKFGLAFLLPVVAFQIFSSNVFHYNLLSGYSFNQEEYSIREWSRQPGSVYYNLGGLAIFAYAYTGEFLKSFGIIGLLFSLIGLWRECLQRNKERIKVYLALLPFSLSFLIYPPTDSRFAFIAAPLLIILATYGLAYLRNTFAGKGGAALVAVLIGVYVVSNYYFCIVGSYRLIFLQLINYLR